MIKFIISKHEGLFEHTKKFHIQHLQSEVLKQYEEVSDSEEADDAGGGMSTLARPEKIRPAQSMDAAKRPSKTGKSVFARPSSMLLKKKMSMPVLPDGSAKKKLAVRRLSGGTEKRASRYLMSQDKMRLAGPQKVRKQKSNTPAIIQPSYYQQRKSGKRSSRLAQPAGMATGNTTEKGTAAQIIASALQPLQQKGNVEEMAMISDDDENEPNVANKD